MRQTVRSLGVQLGMPATWQAGGHLQPLCGSWASNALVEQSSAKYQQVCEGQEVLKLQCSCVVSALALPAVQLFVCRRALRPGTL